MVLIDVPYQLYSHAKKLKMTKDEVKREHKETEGDPHVKARIRQQQQSHVAQSDDVESTRSERCLLRTRRIMRWHCSMTSFSMSAPRVVAKGADAVGCENSRISERAPSSNARSARP